MFKFDILKNPKPYDLYLCKPDNSLICFLNGIDEDTASITLNLNNQYELNFEYSKYLECNGKRILSNGYNSLAYGMKILVNGVGYFKMNYPTGNFDGSKEKKVITATSIDSELEDKDLVSFKVNTGESDSLEYLVTYSSDETETLLNEYTGLPYDYIVFYNTFPEQLKLLLNKYSNGTTVTDDSSIAEIVDYCKLIPRLRNKIVTSDDGNTALIEYVSYTYDDSSDKIISIQLSSDFNARISDLITFYTKYRKQLSLICLAIENCGCNWSIGKIDSELANKKFQFDIDGTNIYAFLTQEVAQATKCAVLFDTLRREINVVNVDNIGEMSNVVLDRKNLLNSLDISCNENSIVTRFNVSGGNDIDVKYVNFGSPRIDDITYFLNARDEYGNLIYVSEELANKYKQFIIDRNSAREKYIEYTKGYNQSLSSIDEIKYRVPNDEIQNDWDTFTNKELDAAHTSFNNLLVTLISLYKEDFGSAGCNSDGSVNESYLKNTIYWYDYYAYNIAIEQINATIEARRNNSSYAEIDDNEILAKINAWKTEWTLFGTVELQNKINAYNNNMTVLVDGQAVVLKEDSDEAKTWDSLSSDEKTQYGNLEINYQYDTYMQNYNERNSCQTYLDTLMKKLDSLEEEKNNFQSMRNALVKLVSIEGYNREELGKLVSLQPSSISGVFSDSEIKTINVLYIDKNYSNSNILTTSLDTTVSEVDVQYELLQDAEEQLSIDSQPQITFQTDIDNLLCMPEFTNYDFTLGNYVILECYENYYAKLRLSSITFNPLTPQKSITVSFTNYVKSRSKRSDLSYILSAATGSGSSSSSGSSGGGSGSFGDSDKIDVTLSNTMLAKLLNTEMFGTRVSNIILDTIQVNKITAKFATFDGLAKGKTTIDGECIKTGVIVSNNYNGTKKTLTTGATEFSLDNTVGSIFKLNDGTFNLAGGKLVYNGELLNINAHLNAVSISTGGKVKSDTQQDGLYVDNNGTLFVGASNTTQINKDGTGHIGAWYFNATQFYNQTITENSDGYIGLATADFVRTINGTSRDLRFAIGSKFGVTKEGKIYAADITIDAGYIGCWTITSTALYKGSATLGTTGNNNAYFGNSGFSLSDKLVFKSSDGNLTISGNITASTLTANSSGTIAGWNISSSGMSYDSDNYKVYVLTGTNSNKDFLVVHNKSDDSYPFYVRADGTLYSSKLTAVNANINGTITTGKLTATGGKIANFTIENGYLYNGIGIGNEGSCGISCGTALSGSDNYIFWAGNGVFRVNKSGQAWLTNASVTGSINATSLSVKNGIYMFSDSYSNKSVISLEPNSSTDSLPAIRVGWGCDYLWLGRYILIDCLSGTHGGYVAEIRGKSYSIIIEPTIEIPNNHYIYTSTKEVNGNASMIELIGMSGANNIWIGGASDAAANGNCYIIATNVYKRNSGSNTSLSDERYKTDIRDIEHADDFIMSLSPKMYRFTDGTSNRLHAGFLAQETQKAMNDTIGDFGVFVRYTFNENVPIDESDPNTYVCGLRYEEIIAPHIKLTQNHHRRIEALEIKISQLKKELFELRKVIGK